MNQVEREREAYSQTPAGQWAATWGITESRDLVSEAEFVEARRRIRKATYGRDLDEGEVRALEFHAEHRTTTVMQAIPVPSTTWEIAQRMRWGVKVDPRPDMTPQLLQGSR